MRILTCMLLISLLVCCKKEQLAPTAPISETVDASFTRLKIGTFASGPFGTVSGTAALLKQPNGSYTILLDSFNTSNGPDLYVYLSKKIMPINFIPAGKLKSTLGTQTYDLPANTQVNDYLYICIHCKSFNHLFEYAPIR